jgi:Reverse transcriptase (RNA-dependent DNA polymerase)
MARHWSLSQSINKKSGICSVCKAIRQIHLKNGTIHLHGPRKNPCAGSHKPPLVVSFETLTDDTTTSDSYQQSSALTQSADEPQVDNSQKLDTISNGNTSTTLLDSSTANDHLPQPPSYSSLFGKPIFDHPRISSPIIKHIPKSVRHLCCLYLSDLLNKLYKSVDDLALWKELFNFGLTYLAKPSRSGKGHTLSSIIKKRFSDIRSTDAKAAEFLPHHNSSKSHKTNSLANLISSKMEDGDVSGAIRLLYSEDKPVYDSSEVYGKLVDRHPQVNYVRRPFKDPHPTSALQVTEKDIDKAIRSFPAGSSGGPDGLRPKHILDLINCKSAGKSLLTSITSFVNMLLDGKCHPDVIPILFGGNLTALVKKSGGIRPIAVGYTWRRIAAKCANAYAIGLLNTYFAPIQLGVGVSGGCEAAVHATRRFVESMPDGYVLVKLDFSNAFNSIHRDVMLDSVYNAVPEIYKFCYLSYAQPSVLRYGCWSISSEEGSQQGDPLGPLLFCLALHPLLQSLRSELAIAYIDDITIGGTEHTVSHDVECIKSEGESFGLSLNAPKCELISSSLSVQCQTFSNFIPVKPSDMCLLGAPLFEGTSLDNRLKEKLHDFERLSSNIRSITSHDALLILRFSLSTPKILHLLRCSPCFGNPILSEIDNVFRLNICHIANVDLSDEQWVQASLPIKFGGLGIRQASTLTLSAFCASATSTGSLQDLILMCTVGSIGNYFNHYSSVWSSFFNCPLPIGIEGFKQRAWDQPYIQSVTDHLLSISNSVDKARLLAVSTPHSGDWLHTLPIASCGLRLENEDVRVAVGLRLGTALCQPHQCSCGAMVEVNGLHGLSCKLGPGKHTRHNIINDLIAKALSIAEIPCIKEPAGLSRSDGKRPDGLTLIPWQAGRSLAWDVTVVDTMAASYISISSVAAGSAAELASARKTTKYEELAKSHAFVPIAIESLGPICSDGVIFLRNLGSRMSAVSGNIHETSHLFQRISVAIQRCNYILFKSTFAHMHGDRD